MRYKKALTKILEGMNELEFAYMFGKSYSSNEYLKNKNTHDGYFKGAVKFIIFSFMKVIKSGKPQRSNCDVLIFANTYNQLQSVKKIPARFSNYNLKSEIITFSSHLSKKNDNAELIGVSYYDFFFAIFLFFTRMRILLSLMKKTASINESKGKYYTEILSVYFYLPVFYGYLRDSNIKVVIVSNDHNPENRVIKEVANSLGIKTCYVQHAHVSNLFPPLDFDYAFLDGVCSLEIYKKLGNIDSEVFLSGSKKNLKLLKKNYSNSGNLVLGVAINLEDEIESVLSNFSILSFSKVIVRLHPRYKFRRDEIPIKKKYDTVSFHSANDVSLADFFDQIDILVAGNSSIHLEAAISGIKSFYIGSVNSVHDYYGFVESELVKPWLGEDMKIELSPSQIVKNYSTTYMTKWQSYEQELVADTLSHIVFGEGEGLPDFKIIENNIMSLN